MYQLKPSFTDLVKSSFTSILKNKSRTILTSLGIIIGVTSVILLTSIGNGLKSYVSDQFDALGANSIYVSPGQVFNESGGFSRGSMTSIMNSFTLKDYQLLKRKLKDLDVMPVNAAYVDLKSSKGTKKDIEINGSTEKYGKNNNLLPSKDNGRWFTDFDKQVIVLGYNIAQDLFPNANAVDKKIIVEGKTLKVIGVVDQKGASMGGPSLDDTVYAPLSVVSDLAGNESINMFVIKAKDKDTIDETKKEISKVLSGEYQKDEFSVYDSSQLLSSINSIISVLTIALTGIAAISLIVGGIGIMNIMLVSVTERTKEIGLRKAIGAYPQAILIQFLIEAVILSCLGGTIGVILGTLGTLAINSYFPAKITLFSVVLAFSVSSTVGIIFGVAPAQKASKLSPIEALRYE